MPFASNAQRRIFDEVKPAAKIKINADIIPLKEEKRRARTDSIIQERLQKPVLNAEPEVRSSKIEVANRSPFAAVPKRQPFAGELAKINSVLTKYEKYKKVHVPAVKNAQPEPRPIVATQLEHCSVPDASGGKRKRMAFRQESISKLSFTIMENLEGSGADDLLEKIIKNKVLVGIASLI